MKNGLSTTKQYGCFKRKIPKGRSSDTPNVTLKADLHQKKIVLSIWWDWKGILYHELLPRNKTMNSNVYCEQLKKLMKEIEKSPQFVNRKGVVLHHDNARPCTSLKTQAKLRELDWDNLPHLPHFLVLLLLIITCLDPWSIIYAETISNLIYRIQSNPHVPIYEHSYRFDLYNPISSRIRHSVGLNPHVTPPPPPVQRIKRTSFYVRFIPMVRKAE